MGPEKVDKLPGKVLGKFLKLLFCLKFGQNISLEILYLISFNSMHNIVSMETETISKLHLSKCCGQKATLVLLLLFVHSLYGNSRSKMLLLKTKVI